MFHLQKCQQVCVQLVLVRIGKAVRRTGIIFQRVVPDQLCRKVRRCGNRYNLVIVAVNNQRGHVEQFQVLGEICFRERLDTVVCIFVSGLHSLEPERVDEPQGSCHTHPTCVVRKRVCYANVRTVFSRSH